MSRNPIKGMLTKKVNLCTDLEARSRADALQAELATLHPDDDETLAGNPRRSEVLAELRTIVDDAEAWTEFTIRASSRASRVGSVMGLAEAGEHISAGDVLAAEAALLADCVVAIDGEPVKLSGAEVAEWQQTWPDDMVQELVDAVRELAAGSTSAPFSRRLSESLATPKS